MPLRSMLESDLSPEMEYRWLQRQPIEGVAFRRGDPVAEAAERFRKLTPLAVVGLGCS